MSKRRAAPLALFLLCLCAVAPGPRIVSVNPCLDSILIAVADRPQIAALSHYARDPRQSGIAAIASTLPFTYETAEEVVALRPDLVLSSVHTSPATREALERLGIRTAVFEVPQTVEASLAQVRAVAAAAGHPERGDALAVRIAQALRDAAPPAGTPLISALVFQPSGFVAGGGTLTDDMLRRAGFLNVAARYGIQQWGNVPLERLLDDPPRVLLSGRAEATGPTSAERLLSHPALASLNGRMIVADFPERLLYCGGPTLIETARVLAAARAKVPDGRP